MKKSLALVSVLLVAALALAACGGGSSGGASTDVKVTMTDNVFTPKQIEVPAGTVKLALENKGSTVHDFVISKLSVKETVAAGQSKTSTFKADKAGTYEILCTQAGHSDAGMKATLIVK